MSENLPFSTKTLLIVLMSAFFRKKSEFFLAKIVPLLKAIMWELREIYFSSVFSFRKIKGYYYCKYNFYRLCVRNPASRLL